MPESSENPELPADRVEPRPSSSAARAGGIDVTVTTESSTAEEQRRTSLAALRDSAMRLAGVLPHPTIPAHERPRFWLRPGDQAIVSTLLTAATVLMAIHWVRLSDWGSQPIEIDRLAAGEYLYRIDVNRATWVEWAQLDGIGETLARRIVDDRERNGPFAGVDDLQRVRGIGRVRMEAMRPHLFHGPAGSRAGR